MGFQKKILEVFFETFSARRIVVYQGVNYTRVQTQTTSLEKK